MVGLRRLTGFALGVLLVALAWPARAARQGSVPDHPRQPPGLSGAMTWRPIGPFRGGRTKALAGVPGHPATLYIGVCNGGVWKSMDYGRTWIPIFDDQPTGMRCFHRTDASCTTTCRRQTVRSGPSASVIWFAGR